MSRNILLSLAFAGCIVFAANAQESPKFKDYPASTAFSGNAVPAQLLTEAEKNFRTRLSAASSQAPNFAGDQVLTTWGCGSGCLSGAAVSLRTGKVTFLPGTVCCWKGEGERLTFRLNSRLLVMAGLINEDGQYGAHFYEFTGQGFVRVKTIPLSDDNDSTRPRPALREPSDSWPKVAETDDTEWRFQPGSLEITKNKRGAQIAVVAGKATEKKTKRIELFKKYVSAADCRRRQGKIVSLNINNDFEYENDFLIGSGSVASELAELVCGSALKIIKDADGKGI